MTLITQRAARYFWGHRQFWVIILDTHVKLTQKTNKCNLGRQLTRVWHTATVFTCIAVRFRQKPPNTGADFSSGQIILIQWLNIRDHKNLPHCIRVHHSRSRTEKKRGRRCGEQWNKIKQSCSPFTRPQHWDCERPIFRVTLAFRRKIMEFTI